MGELGPALKLAPALPPWLAFAGVIGFFMNAWRPFRKMALEREKDISTRLTARIETLERLREEDRATWEKERQRLEEKIENTREVYELRLAAERARAEGELGRMRHRANHADQCIDAFILLLSAEEDALPAKAARALSAMKDMRDRQLAQQAAEAAALTSAKITAATAA